MSKETKTSKRKAKKAPVVEEMLSDEQAKELPGFSFDSIAAAHDEIIEESSTPNESAIAAQETAHVEREVERTGNVDSQGTVFDPELHATNKEGEPSLTSTGKFRKKKGASKVSVTNKQLELQKADADAKAAARAAGQLAADMFIGSATMMLGSEWAPIGGSGQQEPIQFDEHSNMRRAFADYFEARGINDFPPGIALSIAITSYAMPRLVAGEETKGKLSRAKDWLASKWLAMRSKRKPKNAPQSDSRNDGKRQDNNSEETVQHEQSAGTRHPRT